jgi:hypothetical protein
MLSPELTRCPGFLGALKCYSFVPQNLQYLASRSCPSVLQFGHAWQLDCFVFARDNSTVIIPVGTAIIEYPKIITMAAKN